MLSKILLKNNGTTPIDLWTVTDKHCIVPAMRELTYIEDQLTMSSENLVNNLVIAGVLECSKGIAPSFQYKPKLSTNEPVVGKNIILDAGRPGSLPGPRIEIKWFADGVQIEGQYKSGFKPQQEHLGKTIYCSVKASNIIGEAEDQTKETIPVVDDTLPVNTEAPVIIRGEAVVGSTLVVSIGKWDGSRFVEYTWQSAKSKSGPWETITGERGATINVLENYIGMHLRGGNAAQKTSTAPFAYAYTEPVGPVVAAKDDK